MLTKKLPLRITFALIIGSFFVCGIVNADTTIYSQSGVGALTDNITATGFTFQKLGNSLTGVANELTFQYALSSAGIAGDSLEIVIYECDTDVAFNNITGSCLGLHPGSGYSIDLTGKSVATHQPFVTLTNPVSFNPSKYYVFGFYVVNTTGKLKLVGSVSNLWPNGACGPSTLGGGCATVADLFFAFNGVQTGSDVPYTWLMQPSNASTTASTYVYTSFRYHAPATYAITSYAMLFYDITQAESFTIFGTASTGDNTVARYVSLTSGHAYNYSAYICDANETCYGGPQVTFSVVSSSFSIGNTNSNSIYPTSTVLLTPTGVGTILPNPNIVDDVNATSSATEGIQSFGNIPAILSNKYPFNWIYDIANSFNDQGTTTSSDSFPDWSIDYSSFNSTLASSTMAKGILPTKFTILSTTTISTYISDSNRELLKDLMRMAMYVTLGLQVYYMAVSGKFLPTTA